MTNNALPDLLTELYVAHYPGLVRLAAMLLDEPAACEDVVQEACIRAAAARGRYGIPTPRSRTCGGPASFSRSLVSVTYSGPMRPTVSASAPHRTSRTVPPSDGQPLQGALLGNPVHDRAPGRPGRGGRSRRSRAPQHHCATGPANGAAHRRARGPRAQQTARRADPDDRTWLTDRGWQPS